MAKQHLAVELQRIFTRWCEEGLKQTLQGSFLGALDGAPAIAPATATMAGTAAAMMGIGRKDNLPIREFRPSSASSPTSSAGHQHRYHQQQQQHQYLATGPTDTHPHLHPHTTSLVPRKRPSEDGESSMVSPPPSKAGKYYCETSEANMPVPGSERDFRCPYHVKDPTTHMECAGKMFPNPRKLKYVPPSPLLLLPRAAGF